MPECEVSFNTLKDMLCKSPVLNNSDFGKKFILQMDARIEAVLSQVGEDSEERLDSWS